MVNNKYFNDFNEYLSTDPDDMDYDDTIEKDKRKFCEYFCDSIKRNQLLINSFIIVDNIKPKSIKIIIVLLNFNFCGLINGLMYTEEYLTELYNNKKGENFFNFIPRSVSHLIYTFLIVKVLNEIVNCYFIEEKKIKGIFIRGKNKNQKIRSDIIILIKK